MSRISKQKRFEVFKRDSFTCQYCGKSGCRLEADHVQPVCQGGTDDLENLITACFECNRGKSGARLDQPASVIEKTYSKRQAKFAIHKRADGMVDWVGEIISRSGETVEIQLTDAFMLVGSALWQLTDEVAEARKDECRFFLTPHAAAAAAANINNRLLNIKF